MVTDTEIRRIEFAVRELIRIGGHTGNETFFKDIAETIKKLKVMKNCIKINCPAPKIGHPCDGCDVAVSKFNKDEIRSKIKRQRERELEEFERHNATDAYGDCFSDADPGL